MEELSVITVTFEVHKKVAQLNTQIDQKYRHTLSEPAVRHLQATLSALLLAKHAPKAMKAAHLIKADANAELAALLIRTILELKLGSETNLLKLQARLREARRQIGGWRKSLA